MIIYRPVSYICCGAHDGHPLVLGLGQILKKIVICYLIDSAKVLIILEVPLRKGEVDCLKKWMCNYWHNLLKCAY